MRLKIPLGEDAYFGTSNTKLFFETFRLQPKWLPYPPRRARAQHREAARFAATQPHRVGQLDRHAVSIELMVLVVATLPRAQVPIVAHELNGPDPLNLLEP